MLSFGVAGGLDPALPSGTLVLAESVVDPDGGVSKTDQEWRSAVTRELTDAQINFVSGKVLGADHAVALPEDKQRLFNRTGALCVDMESHAVMQVAKARHIPCFVVRAIADSAQDALPDVALAAIDARGDVRYGALVKRLAGRPSELGALIGLWRVSRPAFASLGRVASLPGLGGPL